MKILLLVLSLLLAGETMSPESVGMHLCGLFGIHPVTTNRYYTKNAVITFFSRAPMENIIAMNKNAVGTWDIESGEIEFSVLIKGFVFKKALMQEHFNENYMESNKYPKATFKGIIKQRFKAGSEGIQKLSAEGMLTIHGVSRKVDSGVEVIVKNGKIAANTKFNLLLSDYNISIPALVKNNLSNNVEVSVVVNEFIPFK